PGAIELGLAGSVTSVEGSTRGVIALRGGTFSLSRAGLTGAEAEVLYSHVGSLDQMDLEGNLSLQRAAGESPAYPFLAAAGGVRQEWLGSFRQARYPVGFNLGVRYLVAERGGFRVEYRYRRVLRDPVAEFTEHQVL